MHSRQSEAGLSRLFYARRFVTRRCLLRKILWAWTLCPIAPKWHSLQLRTLGQMCFLLARQRCGAHNWRKILGWNLLFHPITNCVTCRSLLTIYQHCAGEILRFLLFLSLSSKRHRFPQYCPLHHVTAHVVCSITLITVWSAIIKAVMTSRFTPVNRESVALSSGCSIPTRCFQLVTLRALFSKWEILNCRLQEAQRRSFCHQRFALLLSLDWCALNCHSPGVRVFLCGRYVRGRS